jgi:hypothetical protein
MTRILAETVIGIVCSVGVTTIGVAAGYWIGEAWKWLFGTNEE